MLLVGILGEEPALEPNVPAASSGGSVVGNLPNVPPAAGQLDESCLRALNDAQDIAASVDDLGAAASVLDAAALDEVIRRLQPLQERVRTNSAACLAAGQPPQRSGGASPTPAPTPLPSG